ncbi:MAG TPA: hypothetical protein VGI30_01550 [Caulobacteraceae bacterium]
MHPLHLLSYFVGGAFLMNAVPHVVSGAMGRKFPSPFAKPPGKGLSSALVNMLWGFGNLVIAYLLVCKIGRFDLGNAAQAASLALGMFLLGLVHALHFGNLNGGGGPDLA